MPDLDLTSPSAVFALQARMEAALGRVASAAARTVLGLAADMASGGVYAFQPARLADTWAAELAAGIRRAEERGAILPDPELLDALVRSTFVDEVVETVREVFAAAAAQTWSAAETARQMGLALRFDEPGVLLAAARSKRADMSEALRQTGQSWSDAMDTLVRTSATGTTGRVMTGALIEAGYQTKRWVSRRDSKVRPTHVAADGQTAGVRDYFTVGGALLLYPGEYAGYPGETINCRCVMVGVGQPVSASPLFLPPMV